MVTSGYIKEYAGICRKLCKDHAKARRNHEAHIERMAGAGACAWIVAQTGLRIL